MFSVKINCVKSKRNDEVSQTILNIAKFIVEEAKYDYVKIISDENCIEICASLNSEEESAEQQTSEKLMDVQISIYRNFSLPEETFTNEESTDKMILDVKNAAKLANNIEKFKYKQLHLRK